MIELTDEQRRAGVEAMNRAVKLFHTQAGLAGRLGISQQHVSRLAAGDTIDAVVAVKIEQATAGAVRRYELRPDLWDPPKRPKSIDVEASRIRSKSVTPFKVGDVVIVKGTPLDGDRVPGGAVLNVTGILERIEHGKTRGGKRQSKAEEKDEGDGGRAQSQGRPRRKAKGGGER